MDTSNTAVLYAYIAYATIVIAVIVALARISYRTGAAFMSEAFGDRKPFANAMNKVIVIGFLLFEAGVALYILQADDVVNARSGFEVMARKIGGLLILLGGLFLTNMAIVNRMRRRKMEPQFVPNQTCAIASGGYTGTPTEQWAEYARRLQEYYKLQSAADIPADDDTPSPSEE